MMRGRVWLLFWCMCACASAQFEQCDFYQKLQPDQPYYIYSPNYPQDYQPGTSCRWTAEAPVGSQVFLVCENMNLPQSKECSKDHLAVAMSGGDDDVRRFCGSGGFTLLSEGNQMTVELLTSRRSRGGSFLCSIGVERGTQLPDPGKCECGWKNTVRIVGGTNAGVNEYPMMAGIVDGADRSLYCGATIISRNYALTAAHCLINKKPRAIGLLVGDHDTSIGNDTDAARLLLIDRFVVHPQYNNVTQVNDIAVLHTETPIPFSLRVGPACLPFANSKQSFAGKDVEALGWGSTDFGGVESSVLQKVQLKVVTTAECRGSYGDNVSNRQICTYGQDKDACQSDSGGPILWEDPQTRRIKLVGVISYGIGCATNNPSVNTRVSVYIPWIVENADDEFCVK